MNIRTYLNIDNIKIRKARRIGLIFCLILALIASMIFTFYHSTEILFQFYLGYTILRLSIFFFACIVACSSAFDKLFSH